MSDLTPLYVAHRLGAGPDCEANRLKAQRWCAWLSARYIIEPVAPWIILAAEWPETMRDLGLEIDRAAVERVGILVAVGEQPGLSTGMALETSWATTVVDCTGVPWGPDGPVIPSAVDRALAAAGVRRRTNA